MKQSTTYINIEKREMDKILSQLGELIDTSELTFSKAYNWKGCGYFQTYVHFKMKNGKTLEVNLRNNYDIRPKSLKVS